MNQDRLWPKELDYYSALIGRNRALTQGPGGNISLKSGDLIWVKASGLNLADAEDIPIFCPINKSNPTVSLGDSNMCPSIESFLHAYVPHPVVIHVHSVGSISLAIRSKLNERQVAIIRSHKLGYVNYLKPGEDLGKQIGQLIEQNQQLQGAILKNHGIVVWGKEFGSAYEALLRIEEEICKELGIDTSASVSLEDIDYLTSYGFLTPDHAVFSSLIGSRNLQSRNKWIEDMAWCLALALKTIGEDEDVECLESDDVEELLNWDLEKKRQGIQK